MRVILIIFSTLLFIFSSSFINIKKEYTLENKYISRTISVENMLKTVRIDNILNGEKIIPLNNDEFKIQLKGAVTLTTNDFKVLKVSKYKKEGIDGISVELENKTNALILTVFYEIGKNNHFINKYIEIQPKKDILIKRIDIEVIHIDDIYQPYTIKQITTHGEGQWKPGLGQPLYTSKSAAFLGIEFPASFNYVDAKTGYCGYQLGKLIKKDENYKTYKSVIGVSNDDKFVQDAFFKYINQIRVRPSRLQVQYNSWFDYGSNINKEDFYKSITIINNELIKKRGVPQFNNYVIDDGWEDVKVDWSDKAYKINKKFNPDFSFTLSKVNEINSHLGLWMSPGCLFGAQHVVKKYKKQGFETLDNSMSMTGPKYMQLFEDRIIELSKAGVSFFKLDGIFGNLHTREFDIHRYEKIISDNSKVNIHHLSPSAKKLSDSKYDELKSYYLVEGTERLIDIFNKLNNTNPNIYIVISNGAYLSPWWLMYIDAIWLINAKDASDENDLKAKLVYKDNIYFEVLQTEKTQFPLNSIFNHEPKIITASKNEQEFREYLWMSLSRGTGLIDLYLKPNVLSEKEWDILANSLKWVHKTFPSFLNSKMHGGNPGKHEVYGYSGWNANGGYISFYNPSDKTVTYKITLDRKIGLSKNKNRYKISSDLNGSDDSIGKEKNYGDILSVSLQAGQVKVLDFTKVKK